MDVVSWNILFDVTTNLVVDNKGSSIHQHKQQPGKEQYYHLPGQQELSPF